MRFCSSPGVETCFEAFRDPLLHYFTADIRFRSGRGKPRSCFFFATHLKNMHKSNWIISAKRKKIWNNYLKTLSFWLLHLLKPILNFFEGLCTPKTSIRWTCTWHGHKIKQRGGWGGQQRRQQQQQPQEQLTTTRTRNNNHLGSFLDSPQPPTRTRNNSPQPQLRHPPKMTSLLLHWPLPQRSRSWFRRHIFQLIRRWCLWHFSNLGGLHNCTRQQNTNWTLGSHGVTICK